MKILVTGGAGFIGSSLCDALLRAGRSVTAFDNLDPYYDPAVKRRNLEAALDYETFSWHEADILDSAALDRVLKCESPAVIVHLAARAGVRDSLRDKEAYVRTNVKGTEKLLAAAVAAGARRVVFASSSSIYGSSRTLPVKETADLAPMSPYAETKLAGERLCHEFSQRHILEICCLRLFTVFGPRQRPDMAIYKFARAIVGGRPIRLFHQGESSRDYTYVADAVSAIAAAIDAPVCCDVINVGSGRPVRLIDVADCLGKALGRTPKVQFAPAPPTDPLVTWADISRAQNLLDYQPRTAFHTGIQLFVEWLDGLRYGSVASTW